MKGAHYYMAEFIFGMILMAIIWGLNSAARAIMTKIHNNNPAELAKLNIPIYPIICYAKFHFSEKNDEKNEDSQ